MVDKVCLIICIKDTNAAFTLNQWVINVQQDLSWAE